MLQTTPAASATAPLAPPSDIALLNTRFRHRPAADVLTYAVSEPGQVAMVSSFGAESVVLLHMLARVGPATPVLFLDTEMLFAETLAYQRALSESLGLRDVRVLSPSPDRVRALDPDGTLHRRDPAACCALRKTAPLEAVLDGFPCWITGRKRFQGGQRTELALFEEEPGTGRLKINPLAHWSGADIATYMETNHLPRHPLVARGYPSIGCAPCTTAVRDGEDPRSGRWRGLDKTECGIHVVNGRLVRTGDGT